MTTYSSLIPSLIAILSVFLAIPFYVWIGRYVTKSLHSLEKRRIRKSFGEPKFRYSTPASSRIRPASKGRVITVPSDRIRTVLNGRVRSSTRSVSSSSSSSDVFPSSSYIGGSDSYTGGDSSSSGGSW